MLVYFRSILPPQRVKLFQSNSQEYVKFDPNVINYDTEIKNFDETAPKEAFEEK